MTKEEFQIRVRPVNEFAGGSLNAEMDIAYEDLVNLLGEPNAETDGYKVDAEWMVEFDGELFSIYNYKTGKNYNGSEGLDVEDIRDWHIGGKNKVKAAELVKLLQEVV